MNQSMRRSRSAFSLVEVLLAASILSVLLVGTMQMFMVTQGRNTSNDAMLNSAQLAQIVVERVKGRISMNPRFLRDLMGSNKTWTGTGTVADPAGAVNPDGLQLSPFFEFLFTRDNAELCTEQNRISIKGATAPSGTGIKPEDLNALMTAFRDYQVTVNIQDDVDLSNPTSPTALAEMVKVITVTASRMSTAQQKGRDPLAYTLTTRINTPADSMSLAALSAISARFGGPTLEELWSEFFLIASSNPFLPADMSEDDKRIVADAFLVTAGANNEALLVGGRQAAISGSFILNGDPEGKYLDAWISEFVPTKEFSSSKAELTRLYQRKSVVIFDAFNQIRLPLKHLTDQVFDVVRLEVQALEERLTQVEATLAALQVQVQAALAAYQGSDYDAALAAYNAALGLQQQYLAIVEAESAFFKTKMGMIRVCGYLRQFYNDPNYSPVAVRPASYGDNFGIVLNTLSGNLVEHLDQVDGPTPIDRMAASQKYVDATSARQLYDRAVDATALVRLRGLGTLYSAKMADLASYLQSGEVHDMNALATRNPQYYERGLELKTLSSRYRDMIALFRETGLVFVFLAHYESFFNEKISADGFGILDDLGDMLAAGPPQQSGGEGEGEE